MKFNKSVELTNKYFLFFVAGIYWIQFFKLGAV